MLNVTLPPLAMFTVLLTAPDDGPPGQLELGPPSVLQLQALNTTPPGTRLLTGMPIA